MTYLGVFVALGCQHCGHTPATRPRRLCYHCYRDPAVKALYPVGSGNPATAKYAPGRPEQTLAELEALIRARYPTMPAATEREREWRPQER